MSQITKTQLDTEIQVIKDETSSGANTATRVGGTLQDLADTAYYVGAWSSTESPARFTAQSVPGTAIVDGTVSSAKLASASVTAAKIGSSAVTTDKIYSKAVTAAKIADKTITNAQIADATITQTQIQDNTLSLEKCTSSNATSSHKISGYRGFDFIIAKQDDNVYFDNRLADVLISNTGYQSAALAAALQTALNGNYHNILIAGDFSGANYLLTSSITFGGTEIKLQGTENAKLNFDGSGFIMSNNSTIENLNITSSGVGIKMANRCVVKNCVINNTGSSVPCIAIGLGTASSLQGTIEYPLIRDNILINNGASGILIDFYAAMTNGGDIQDNVMYFQSGSTTANMIRGTVQGLIWHSNTYINNNSTSSTGNTIYSFTASSVPYALTITNEKALDMTGLSIGQIFYFPSTSYNFDSTNTIINNDYYDIGGGAVGGIATVRWNPANYGQIFWSGSGSGITWNPDLNIRYESQYTSIKPRNGFNRFSINGDQ